MPTPQYPMTMPFPEQSHAKSDKCEKYNMPVKNNKDANCLYVIKINK